MKYRSYILGCVRYSTRTDRDNNIRLFAIGLSESSSAFRRVTEPSYWIYGNVIS